MSEVTVVGHQKRSLMGIAFPDLNSTKSERKQWDANQSLYHERLGAKQPLSQKGDPLSYSKSLPMYISWTQEQKNYRAMQAFAVGIMAAPALIATSPAEIGFSLTAQKVTAFAIDATVQTAVNAMEHRNIFSNYNFLSGATSILIGAPEGASLSDLAQVSLLNSEISSSVNISERSLFGPTTIFRFNPSEIIINATFGTLAGKYSQLIGNGAGSNAFGDGASLPINVAGAAASEAVSKSESKEQ